MANENPKTIVFEHETPGWSCEGAEPRAEFKAEGFKAGYRPPAGYFNWFWTRVSRCVAELQNRLANYAEANEADKTSLQSKLNGKAEQSALTAHTTSRSNPHVVTKDQVGLSAVSNVAQMPASYWSYVEQGGTPYYVWGANAANQYKLWRPANMSVNYANSAGSAGSASSANYANSAGSASTAGTASALTQWPAIGPNAKISADAGGFYFMATGPYHMVNYWNTGYNSVQAWTFTAVSTEEAKTDIRQTGEDLGRGLLEAAPVLYKQKPLAEKAGRSAGLLEGKEPVPPPEQLGFTAEQLSEVFPEAVVYEEEKPAGINLYALITGTVALCQRQQQEIDALHEQGTMLEELKERVAVLEALLAASDRE